MDGITEGRIVHYVLSEQDVAEINRRRTNGQSIVKRIAEDKWCLGAQAHIGNQAEAGQHCAAIIVRDWHEASGCVNLKVELDGSDCFWATSRCYSEEIKPFTWHWIERV